MGLERTPTSRPCLTAHMRYTNLVCPISKAPVVVIAAEGQPPSLLLSLLHRNQLMPPERIEETVNVLCRKHDTAKCQEFVVAELQHFLLCPACSRRGSLYDSMCAGGNGVVSRTKTHAGALVALRVCLQEAGAQKGLFEELCCQLRGVHAHVGSTREGTHAGSLHCPPCHRDRPGSCSYREHFTCYGSAITREMLSVTAAARAVSVAHESETFLQSLRHVMGRN